MAGGRFPPWEGGFGCGDSIVNVSFSGDLDLVADEAVIVGVVDSQSLAGRRGDVLFSSEYAICGGLGLA